jgi:hypothetical protein
MPFRSLGALLAKNLMEQGRTGSTESLSVMALPVRRLLGEAFRRSAGE